MRALVQTKLKGADSSSLGLTPCFVSTSEEYIFELVPRLNFSFSLVLLSPLVTCLITFLDLRDPESV